MSVMGTPDEVTSADGWEPLRLAFEAQWPAAAEFRRFPF